MTTCEMSPADYAAINGNNNNGNNNGWGGAWGEWILVFLIFAIFGWGGFGGFGSGFGGNGGGSGIITLRGITNNQCFARYRVSFGANIAVSTGSAVGAISLAIAINGEPVETTNMIVTPAAVNEYFNVSTDVFINVPKGCCYTIAIENTSTIPVSVQNANIIIDRVA